MFNIASTAALNLPLRGARIWNTEAAAGAVTHLTELGPAALRAPSAPADYDDAKFEALSTKLPASMTGKAFKVSGGGSSVVLSAAGWGGDQDCLCAASRVTGR